MPDRGLPSRRGGFTLVELLIALAVIGIIAAIAIPNLLNALQRGRQKRTMGDMRAVAMAVHAYSVDGDNFVAQDPAGPLGNVGSYLEPTYVAKLPDHDAWGTPFVYLGQERGYELTSYGRDRNVGGGGTVGQGGLTTDFANDIVLATGAFTQYPEGVQN